MTTFSDVLDVERLDATTFRMHVPDGWQQGRGAYGGLVIGAMVRAATGVVDDASRRVRSVNAEFLGPVLVGKSLVKVDPVRVSSALSVMRVRVLPAGSSADDATSDALFHATVLCAKARPETPSWNRIVPPQLAPREALSPLATNDGVMPVFTRHFEYRLDGPAPYSADARPLAQGYVRPNDAGKHRDAAMIAALADCYWPACLSSFREPRPIATISFALAILDDVLPEDACVYHRAECAFVADGYAHERRELWSPDGRLLATNQQVVAIIR